MNLTEQIKAYESVDYNFRNKTLKSIQNIRSINRLLNEAEKNTLNYKELYTNTPRTTRNISPTRKLEALHEYKLNERVKLPKLEPSARISNEEKIRTREAAQLSVRFSENLPIQKRVHRVNLYGYESINEEPIPIINRISPKQKEPKLIAKPQMENLIKRPSLRSLKLSNEKKTIVFKEEPKKNEIKEEPNKPLFSTVVLSKREEQEINRESKMTFSSQLSEDANYAMLKTYEDMLYLELLTIYPESENLSRTKTKDFIQIPRKMTTKLPPIDSRLGEKTPEKEPEAINHQRKISQHLEKAMLISDIIKKTKGELTTNNRQMQCNNLLCAFEEWKSNWQTIVN